MVRTSTMAWREPRRRGSAMLLALIAVATAFVIGLSFLASSTTTTGTAQTLYHHARARALAESAIALTQAYGRNDVDWRSSQPIGDWLLNGSLYDGTISISAAFDPTAATGPVSIDDPSFEQGTGELDTPLVAPPMNGVIGGWEMQRTALVETGPTVPGIGIAADASATSGANAAFISFDASVDGTGTIGQTLAAALVPKTTYRLSTDISPGGLTILDTRFGVRVLAGGVTVASTEHAATMVLPALPDQLPTPPTQPPTLPEVPSVLEVVGLGGGFSRFELQFEAGDAPPPGPLRLELFATSMGLLNQIQFDNIQLEMIANDPLVVTAIGRFGTASHRVTATLSPPAMTIARWLEP